MSVNPFDIHPLQTFTCLRSWRHFSITFIPNQPTPRTMGLCHRGFCRYGDFSVKAASNTPGRTIARREMSPGAPGHPGSDRPTAGVTRGRSTSRCGPPRNTRRCCTGSPVNARKVKGGTTERPGPASQLGPAFCPAKWSWRESNPRPPTDSPRHLRAYLPVLFSSLDHRPGRGPSRASRANLACAVTAPNAGQPELASLAGPPQAGQTGKREVRKPLGFLLTQPERSYGSRLLVSRRFYEVSEDLGTQPRLHHTRRNLDSPITRVVKHAPNLSHPAPPVNPLVLQRLTGPGYEAHRCTATRPAPCKERASDAPIRIATRC